MVHEHLIGTCSNSLLLAGGIAGEYNGDINLGGRRDHGNKRYTQAAKGEKRSKSGIDGTAAAGYPAGGQPLGDRRDTAEHRDPQVAFKRVWSVHKHSAGFAPSAYLSMLINASDIRRIYQQGDGGRA